MTLSLSLLLVLPVALAQGTLFELAMSLIYYPMTSEQGTGIIVGCFSNEPCYKKVTRDTKNVPSYRVGMQFRIVLASSNYIPA